MPDPVEPDVTLDEPTHKPEAPSSPQPVDWEKRYKGLQQTYDRLQKKYEALSATHDQLTADLEEIRQSVRGHENEKKVLTEALSKLDAAKKELEGQVASHSIERERIKLIMSEFSDLAGFEADGLLPTAATIEELKPKLETFRNHMNTRVDSSTIDKVRGTPPSGGSGGTPSPRSKEVVYAEITRLAGSHDPKDRLRYDDLMKEWLDLNP